MALLEKEKLREILPQKSRMALIDRLISLDKECALGEAEIDETNLFFDEELGGVPSWIALEMIAQTVAASAAVMAEKTTEGMVLSVNNYSANVPIFRCGDVLEIMVKEDFAAPPVFRYEGKIKKGNEELVSAKITVAQGDLSGQQF